MMKKTLLTLLSFVFFAGIWAPLQAKRLSGYSIMRRQEKYQDCRAEYEQQSILLIDKNGRKEMRKAKNYMREVKKDVHKSLVVFLAPSRIRGTSLLTWQNKKRQDDQWLYQPARRKMQRISEGSKKNYFMGTDYTYEDMQSEELKDFYYKRLRDRTLDGKACFVVAAYPKTKHKKRETNYSKRVLWIRKRYYYTIQVKFYDKRGRYMKLQRNRKFRRVHGRVFRPNESVMINHRLKHKTLIKVTRRRVNHRISSSVFSQNHVLKGKHLAK